MIAAAVVLAAVGPLALRLGWRHDARIVTAGWATIIAACVLALEAGAWGLAATALGVSAAGLAVLAREAWVSPVAKVVPFRSSVAATGAPWANGLPRRLAVFFLTVPAGGAASLLFAFGGQAAARRAGWGEADALALALFLQPIAWALLASWQLVSPGPRAMTIALLAAVACGLLLWRPW